MQLIAVRHAETEWNRAGREMGQLDSPLTDRGETQADALARRLATVPFDELYSSDLGRATQTAAHISRVCGRPVRAEPELRERHMGVLQGLTRAEARARHPEIYEAYDRSGFYDRIPDGESALQRRDRSVRALTAIATRHPDTTVVVVTHSGFLSGFLEFVLDLPFGGSRHYPKDHASLNYFVYSAAGWALEAWNDVAHLTETATVLTRTSQIPSQ